MKKIAALIVIGFFFFGCQNSAPQLPEVVASWQEYSRPELGFKLKVPSYFSIDEDETGARFRYDGHPSISVSYTTEDEADGRGLWAGNQIIKEVVINYRKWNMYIYDHYDGPYYMRVVSFVTKNKNKYLAVEFRIDGDLQKIHREIMEKVSITI